MTRSAFVVALRATSRWQSRADAAPRRDSASGAVRARIADSAGLVLAVSPGYPARIADVATRQVTLPGGRDRRPRSPLVCSNHARHASECGVPELSSCSSCSCSCCAKMRAERIAMHSFNLELVSRDLLDANVRLEERPSR